ncbi:MAG: S-layer homology domain-containing protein [Actinobacteria bacterium]|nr:S-layer homology domain-containing protein [Actinomycetota bacterium]
MKKLTILAALVLVFLFAATNISMAALPNLFNAQNIQVWTDPRESVPVDIDSVAIDQDDKFLYFGFGTYDLFNGSLLGDGYAVFFLDVDQNPATGDTDFNNIDSLGPDFALEISYDPTTTGSLYAILYKLPGPGDYTAIGAFPVVIADSGDKVATRIPLSYLPSFSGIDWDLWVKAISSGNPYFDYVPDNGYYTYKAPTTTQPINDPTLQPTIEFVDIPSNAWYKPYVDTLVVKDIISGYPDKTFRPLANITRAEFAKVIILAIGENPSTAPSSFTDVLNSHWAKAYIQRARELNIIGGYPDSSFRPNNNVTRQEIAKMVVMAGKFTAVTTYRADFTDVPSTLWSWPYILTAKDSAVIDGYPDSTFRPTSPASRVEACKMVQVLVN